MQFRLLLNPKTVAQTPDFHVNVTLLNTAGQVVGLLTLKPDSSGGVTGLFDLSPDVLPGSYTLRATANGAQRDFPIVVNPVKNETLGVYITPITASDDGQVITGTVNVVGPHGEPEAGMLLTGTLHILGDTWVSMPVTATTTVDGRANVTTHLPEWSGRFNEPGVYLQVDAAWQGNSGSDRAPLDLATVRHLQTGNVDMVSPSMNIAAIAQPGKAGLTSLRVVALSDSLAGGDILVIAEPKAGSRQAWAFNMELARSKGDVTLTIPNTYAGGTLYVSREGVEGSRSIYLPDGSDTVSLSVAAPEAVSPGSDVPVVLSLKDTEGQGVAGDATLVWRRVSGLDESKSADALPWEPSVKIGASNPVTVTLAAPNSPGLWFIECRSSTTPDGAQIVGRAAVQVMPAPLVMMPGTASSTAGDAGFSTTIYNPGPSDLSGNVQATGDGAIVFVSDNPQLIDVPPGGWQRLTWRVRASQPGGHTITFAMRPSGSPDSTWSMHLSAPTASQESITYAAGDMTGQQTVGVQVPTGMDGNVRLQVRASTSLLSALADAAISEKDRDGAKDIDYWATILCAAPSVNSAYRRANLDSPSGLERSTAYRSLALQEIYALQHTDGGWSKDTNIDTPSSPAETAAVLLAIRRQDLAATEANEDLQPEVDSAVETRALSFLTQSTTQSLSEQSSTAQLDERARSFYALSLYGAARPQEVRPLIAYLPGGANTALSQAGEAWLALALWQGGNFSDSLAVLDRLMDERPDNVKSAGPALEALAVMNMANRNNAKLDDGLSGAGNRTSSRGSDQDLEREYVQLLMQARQGAGWGTTGEADAIWALSRYAAEDAGRPAGRPDVTLNDGALGVASVPGNADTFVVDVAGGPLHAGTNWLKLQGLGGQSIYYSLTLTAER